MAVFGGIRGFLQQHLFGFALGTAAAPALAPFVQDLVNEAWSINPVRPPAVVILAQGVAQGQIDRGAAGSWAAQQGFGGSQFDALVAAFDTGPGVAQAFELWRRGLIGEAGFRRAAKREGLEQEWIDALVPLKRRLLSPDELANAVVQGFRTQDAARADAELQGLSGADFDTMVDVTGLPPGPETLQDWTRRGIIDEAGLAQGIREGHTKIKYIDEYVASLKRVLSAAEYAGLHLRGWITEAEMNAGGALTGYGPEDMNRLYLNRGRPATTRQVHIGYQRGGRLAGVGADERATFQRAVEESNIRPEWEPILWAARYTYPTAFVLRALTQDDTFTAAQTEQILIESGWRPDLAKQAATKWAGAGPTGSKTLTKTELAAEYEGGFVSEAEYRTGLTTLGYTGRQQDLEVSLSDAKAVATERGRVVTALHKLFVNRKIDEAQASTDLAATGMQPAAVARILPLWTLERDAAARELTDAQIRAAYRKGLMTLDAAAAELVSRGYTDADARTFLQS